ncbi:hypothetical protein [Collimonas silvisoli]|uniref:hypothetical protein n=1 Tax=Collimonas silvisoli TaxID=2825884 RepID=UPI001B8D183D|nr:hypothetical protein [Collimonas silvisoli]
MRSQKILAFISYIVPLAACIKFLMLFLSRAYTELLFWIIGTAWVVWLIFSFRFNKNLPGVGPFNYGDGKNQEARSIFTIAVITAFFLAVFFS